MKTNNIIGVIGGMGPQASIEFYRLLIAGARCEYGASQNDQYPEIIIDSLPVPDFLGETSNMELAAHMLEDRVTRLARFGATTITMACNTACLLADRLQNQTDVPFVSVVSEVVKKVSEKHVRVLLLASPVSLRYGLYQLELSRYGLSYVVPDKRDYAKLEYIIREVINESDKELLKHKLIKLTERYLQDQAIDAILLGCTEMPLVFPQKYRIPVFSSLSILAESVLKLYYKEVI